MLRSSSFGPLVHLNIVHLQTENFPLPRKFTAQEIGKKQHTGRHRRKTDGTK